MKTYILIGIFLLGTKSNGFSQGDEVLKIDSLKKVLTSLNDTARIDCLNSLSHEYIIAQKKDSASYYASLAYEKAINRNYLYGIAASYYNQSEIAEHFYHDVIKAEKLTREGIIWSEKISGKKGISDLYIQLAVIVGIQSRYNASVAYSKIAYEYAEKAGDMSTMTKSLFTTGQAYLESGEYEKAFYFLQKAYQRYLEMKDDAMISLCLFVLGELYMYTGDYNAALTNPDFKNLTAYVSAEKNMAEKKNYNISLYKINFKAVSDFKNTYTDISDETWEVKKNGYVARFTFNSVITMNYYDKKGRWLHSIQRYDETKLPGNVRALVKSTYYDYSITLVQEINVKRNSEKPIFIVHIKYNDTFKTIRVCDGEMEEVNL